MKLSSLIIIVLLAFIFLQLYIIDMGVKVINNNLVEICKILNPDNEVTVIKTFDDYRHWREEEANT